MSNAQTGRDLLQCIAKTVGKVIWWIAAVLLSPCEVYVCRHVVNVAMKVLRRAWHIPALHLPGDLNMRLWRDTQMTEVMHRKEAFGIAAVGSAFQQLRAWSIQRSSANAVGKVGSRANSGQLVRSPREVQLLWCRSYPCWAKTR